MLDLKTNATKIKITNEHEVFKDTEYANSEFYVEMKNLSTGEQMQNMRKNTHVENGTEIQDTYGLTVDQLVSSVTDWGGIGSDGKEIKCTPENVRAIFNYSQEFAGLLIEAYAKEFFEKDDKKK